MNLRTQSAIWAFAICYLIHLNAFASDKTIALVGGSPSLLHATKTALKPWHIDVVSLPADAGLRDESSAAYAELAAKRHGVAAVVWFGDSKDRYRIWLYDAASRGLAVRELPVTPPLSDADAASVALSIKTMLRHSKLVPIEVRQPRKPLSPAPSTPRAAAAAGELAGQPAHAAHAVYIELGALMEPVLAAGPDLRLGLGWRYAPARWSGRYFVAAGVDLGPGVAFRKSGAEVRISAQAMRVQLGWRIVQSRHVLAALALGGSARLVTLRGELVAGRGPIRDWRVNPSADAAVLVGIPVGRVAVAGRIGLSHNLRRQRYMLGERPLARIASVDVESSAMLMVSLPF